MPPDPLVPSRGADRLLSPHFSQKELACPHCGLCIISVVLIAALEKLRQQGPEPIIVHDACRCPEHNKFVGGAANSEHLCILPNYDSQPVAPARECIAADIEIQGLSLQEQYDRAKLVPEFRSGGIGVYPGPDFLHVDVRLKPARWARVGGAYVGIATSGLKL